MFPQGRIVTDHMREQYGVLHSMSSQRNEPPSNQLTVRLAEQVYGGDHDTYTVLLDSLEDFGYFADRNVKFYKGNWIVDKLLGKK